MLKLEKPFSTCGKSKVAELHLVRLARTSFSERQRLRQYLDPLVASVIDKYQPSVADRHDREDLQLAAWKYFDFAINSYLLRADRQEVPFKFSTYYSWFAKEGVEALLESE